MRGLREASGRSERAGYADARDRASGSSVNAGNTNYQCDEWAAQRNVELEELVCVGARFVASAIPDGRGHGGGDGFDFAVHHGRFSGALEARGFESGDGAAHCKSPGAFDICEERKIRERFARGVRDSNAAAAGIGTFANTATGKSVAFETAGEVADFAESRAQPGADRNHAGVIGRSDSSAVFLTLISCYAAKDYRRAHGDEPARKCGRQNP